MLAVKRARPRLALFAATFGVVFLLSALAVGLSGYLAGSATSGARAGLSALTGSSGGFRITIPLASDGEAQDARVETEIHDAIRADGVRVPVRVFSDVETLAAVELDGPRGVVRPALASIPHLDQGAALVSGAWPTSAKQASIQADAARALGVRVGDQYSLPGGARVTIVGTWRVRNAADPRWLGGGLPISGLGDAGVQGFVVVDPSLWKTVGSAPVARWTVVPVANTITSDQLSALQAAPDSVPTALLADKRNGTSVDQDGRLQPAMVPIISNVQAAAAVSIAPLVIVGVLGLVTLIELARMLTQLRAGESELLSARGATRGRLVGSAALEGLVVAAPAAIGGAFLAAALLPLLAGASTIPFVGWAGAVLVGAGAVVVLAAAAGLSAPEDAPRPAGRGERVRGAFGIAIVALTILAAVVAVSQFLLYGSPLTTTASGAVGVDPLAVAAPALALAALSLLGLALFPVVARGAERLARTRVGLGSLPIQQLARRDRASITPVLLVALAVGGLVFAATYSGTWQTSSAQTRSVQVGTGVRVIGQSSISSAETRRTPGQSAASPAGSADVQVGNSLAPLVELPIARIRDVVAEVPTAVDPAKLARDLTNPVARPRVPSSASVLDVTFIPPRPSAVPDGVTVTVVDAIGSIYTIDGVAVADGFTVQLPSGTAPWVVRAIGLQVGTMHKNDRVAVRLSGHGAPTPIALGTTWTLSNQGAGHAGFVSLPGANPGIRATARIDGARLLLQPTPARGTRLPVVISSALAKSSGVHVGGVFDLPLVASGGDVPAVVRGIVPVIPGLSVDEGVLADLGAVQDSVLREGLNNTAATEWWIATTDPAASARFLRSRVPVGAVIETSDAVPADQVLESADTIVWIAAIAIALLGMLAVAAGLIVEVRARLGQVALLRALGVGRRIQSRGRVVEIGTLLVLGLVAGIVDGVVVSSLIVPDLARTAVPGALAALPTFLSVDLPAGLASLLAVVLVAGALLLATAWTVRRQAALTASAEERR